MCRHGGLTKSNPPLRLQPDSIDKRESGTTGERDVIHAPYSQHLRRAKATVDPRSPTVNPPNHTLTGYLKAT